MVYSARRFVFRFAWCCVLFLCFSVPWALRLPGGGVGEGGVGVGGWPWCFSCVCSICTYTVRSSSVLDILLISNKDHLILSGVGDKTISVLRDSKKKKKKKKKKNGREKSRECHNHKPQPFPDTKRERKPTNLNKHKRTNVRKALRLALISPSEVIAILKGLKNTRTK